jgi:hypothetical protein
MVSHVGKMWADSIASDGLRTALSTERRSHRQLVAAPLPLVPCFPRVYSQQRKSPEPLPRDVRAGLGLEQSALTPPSKHFRFMLKITTETSWILPTPCLNRTRQRARTPGAPRRSRRIDGVELETVAPASLTKSKKKVVRVLDIIGQMEGISQEALDRYSKLFTQSASLTSCRMDLPGPTTSVGTGTNYSMGPCDYSTWVTLHLIAWGTRTTVEEYSDRKLCT